MDWTVDASRFSSGVPCVRRAIEMTSIRRHRAVARHCVFVTCRAAIFILSLLVVQAAYAQSEEQIMSAFLFNFARYVEWPKHVFDRPDSPVEICTLGADEFGGVVSRTVSGKIVGDRPVSVRVLGDAFRDSVPITYSTPFDRYSVALISSSATWKAPSPNTPRNSLAISRTKCIPATRVYCAGPESTS